MQWWRAISVFWGATWNNCRLYFTLLVVHRLLHLIRLAPHPDIKKKKKNQPSLHSWHLSVAHQSIVSYHLCLSIIINPPDWTENICIYGAQADGDQWKQCARVLQRDRLQSGWEWEEAGEGRGGGGWGGSLHTNCQCLGESWFPQARGQAELLQEWSWSS